MVFAALIINSIEECELDSRIRSNKSRKEYVEAFTDAYELSKIQFNPDALK